MPRKTALITLCRDEVAPRFDMSAEALIVPISLLPPAGRDYEASPAGRQEEFKDEVVERRHLVLAHVSGEELCDVATGAGVSTVICGGIEEDYYHYLRWKRIEVLCDVMGPAEDVLARLRAGALRTGDCLYKTGSDAGAE